MKRLSRSLLVLAGLLLAAPILADEPGSKGGGGDKVPKDLHADKGGGKPDPDKGGGGDLHRTGNPASLAAAKRKQDADVVRVAQGPDKGGGGDHRPPPTPKSASKSAKDAPAKKAAPKKGGPAKKKEPQDKKG